MASNRSFRIAVTAAALFAVVPAAYAQNTSSPEAAAIQAHTQRALAEGGIASNRPLAIEMLVRHWRSALPNEVAVSHFEATLSAASTRTLARLFTATSFEQVREILLGRATSELSSGAITIQNLGASNELTFTPVNPPCRIFDTRN